MNDRYSVEAAVREGLAVIVLSDKQNQCSAELIPEIGNNLYRFASGGLEVIKPPISIKAFKQHEVNCFRYGTPILFPPNRVKKGQFSFRGRTYSLPLNEPPEHHLHGEISRREWKIVAYGASQEQGAWVTARFRYADHPEILAYFPHPIIFTMTYRLIDGRLSLEGAIQNEGADEAPFAFGLHPYFSIPFESDSTLLLHLPANEEWPVTRQAFVSGRPSVTEFSQKLREGAHITEYPVLGCSMLSIDNSSDRTCRIALKERGYSIAYQLDRIFPFVLLFRPDWAEAFSLEPYTCVTDAFNLPYEHELTGARGIQAGEEICFTNTVWVEKIS